MSVRYMEIMTPPSWPSWLNTSNHIGSHYPYYNPEVPNEFSLRISDAIKNIPPDERELDKATILGILSRRFPLGDRSLITKLRRAPWMAKPTSNGWKFHNPPPHGTRKTSVNQVTTELLTKLKEEARSYTESSKNIGILLSGGLDSRIVAGIVRVLELNGDLNKVSTFTWGVDGCRDVYYARQIAEDFGWEFNHFRLDADTLKRNIRRAGELGAEFSPLHLHALPEVRDQADVDVILAGSYGNSIGRAEYSGKHVLDLEQTVPYRLNKFGVLKHNVISTNRDTIYGDAYKYRTRIERPELYQYREIERQLHYMRRLLQPCMTHVAEQVPLHQLFTAPGVVELMWGLDPESRGKAHCVEVLKRLPGDLESIPNAKSGIPPNGTEPVNDGLDAKHHKYGPWLRDDLREAVCDLINNGPLFRVFNKQAVNRLLRVWSRASTRSTNAIDELVSWLASLAIFIQEYDISIQPTTNSFVDSINGVVGPISAQGYQAVRGRFRE